MAGDAPSGTGVSSALTAASLLSDYLAAMQGAMQKAADQTSAMLGVIANCWALSQALLPRIIRHCSLQFGRPIVELQQLAPTVESLFELTFSQFVASMVEAIASKHLSPPQVAANYAAARGIPAPEPSDPIRRSASQLLSVAAHARSYLEATVHSRAAAQLWAAVAQQIASGLASSSVKNSVDAGPALLEIVAETLSPAGRSQLALDCHFMLALLDLLRPSDIASGPPSGHWQELLRAVEITARAEGSAETASDFAQKLFELINPLDQ